LRPVGQKIATSLVVPLPPLPVLSPTRHPDGSPARRRASPVLFVSSQEISRPA